jgi:hypothetical protein
MGATKYQGRFPESRMDSSWNEKQQLEAPLPGIQARGGVTLTRCNPLRSSLSLLSAALAWVSVQYFRILGRGLLSNRRCAAELHGAGSARSSWDELNAHLEAQCGQRQARRLRSNYLQQAPLT